MASNDVTFRCYMTTTVHSRSQYFLTTAGVLLCLTIIACIISSTQLNPGTGRDTWTLRYWKDVRKAEVASSFALRGLSCPNYTQQELRELREQLLEVADSNVLVVSMTNNAFLNFALNWVHHVKMLNISNFVIASLDDDTFRALVFKDVHTFRVKTGGLENEEAPWGSPAFHSLGRVRVCLIEAVLHLGFDVMFSDVDVIFLRDPFRYFNRYPKVDVLVSSDAVTYSTIHDELELDPRNHGLNVGLLMMRPSALPLVRLWKARLQQDLSLWEQGVFNEIVHESTRVQWVTPQCTYNGSAIRVGVLPVLYFCSGHTYFVEKRPQKLLITPYIVHATFQFSGAAGKELRFKESLLWNFSDDYFTHPVGFMTFKMDYDIANWTESLQGHFQLINHQLRQIRHGVALAQALRRVLIVPELLCGMDRYWSGHSGRIPDSNLELPFFCPLDHVFNIEAWNNFVHKIRGVEFRESSFLNNTRQPKDLIFHEIYLETNSTYEEIAGPLRDKSPSVVLRFHGLSRVGLFHKEVTTGNAFMKDMNRLTDLWCCLKDAHPGHIWYDAFWDKIPHIDKHGYVWRTEWTPLPGP